MSKSYVIGFPVLHNVIMVRIVVAAVDVVGHLQQLRVVVPRVGGQAGHPAHAATHSLNHGIIGILKNKEKNI